LNILSFTHFNQPKKLKDVAKYTKVTDLFKFKKIMKALANHWT